MLPVARFPTCQQPVGVTYRPQSTGRQTAWAARTLIPGLVAVLASLPLAASAQQDMDFTEMYRKASMSFADQAQSSIQTHQAQLRARQQRLARANSRDMPRFMNQLELSDRSARIPLQTSSSLKPGTSRLLNSAPGKTNVYVRGTLYSINNTDGIGLTTPGTIFGSDQQVNEEIAIGFAAGRISTQKSSGTVLSAYMSMNPGADLMLDMSVSLGSHRARHAFLQSYTPSDFNISGYSQALSLALNRQPKLFYGWTFSPYSRYDLVATRLDARYVNAAGWHGSRALSSLSFGSVMETDWFGMFGSVRPRLQLELRHQIADGTGLVRQRHKTQGVIGLGLTSRVSRDLATFAESRYAAQSGNSTPESLLMLGVRLGF